MEILFSHVFDGITSTLSHNFPEPNFILMGFANNVEQLVRTLREKGGLVVSVQEEDGFNKIKITELTCVNNDQENLLLRMNNRFIKLTLIPNFGIKCEIYIE